MYVCSYLIIYQVVQILQLEHGQLMDIAYTPKYSNTGYNWIWQLPLWIQWSVMDRTHIIIMQQPNVMFI